MGIVSFIYSKALVKRYDDNRITHYFSYTDFPGLKAKPIEFKTPQGNTIKGNFYSYPDCKSTDLIVFCHGIGGGHRSYMREIERICREGYEVLSYDNTGCFESEGKNIRGMTESLNCLDSCLTYLKSSGLVEGRRISLIGHSWGGYAVANAPAFHKDIYSVTVISSFPSIQAMANGVMGGKLGKAAKSILKFEKKVNPKYAECDAVQTLDNCSAKLLFVHSKDDSMVSISSGLEYYRANLKRKDAVYLVTDGKHHNPNYMEDAVNYMNETFGTYQKLVKEKKLKTFAQKQEFMNKADWVRMTEQDDSVWSVIFENLK